MTKIMCVSLVLLVTAAVLARPVEATNETEKTESLQSELHKAPSKASARENPYAARPEAVQAGRKLYERHCASCHGDDVRGIEKAPALRAEPIHEAAPGALFWFLRNGNIRDGMPSWSHLPDQQLWQLVTYLQSLR